MRSHTKPETKIELANIKESVRVAKKYLDEELAKYESWEELSLPLINLLKVDKHGNELPIRDAKKAFAEAKRRGVGQTTILKFLGGNWKQGKIQKALAQLKESKFRLFEVLDRIRPQGERTDLKEPNLNLNNVNENSDEYKVSAEVKLPII